MTDLALSLLALAVAIAALVYAYRTRCRAPAVPSREERIAIARGHMSAARAAELTLSDQEDLPAKLILANHRANAAHARECLRLLGIEV